MKQLPTCVAVLAFSVGPVFSGSLEPPAEPVVAPPAPVSGDWAGPYAGVQIGFGDFDLDAVLPPPAAGNAPTIVNQSDDGFLYGIHAGYNWDPGQLVYGAEADIDFTDISFGATDIDNIARLRMRLGLDADQAFVYGTGGAAYMNGSGGGIDISGWGWVAGAGVDFRLNEDWVIGGDALYHSFEDVSPSGNVEGTTYRLRASFRF